MLTWSPKTLLVGDNNKSEPQVKSELVTLPPEEESTRETAVRKSWSVSLQNLFCSWELRAAPEHLPIVTL